MNIRQVRTKIRSVSNIKKITQAMQLMAAIKMRKAQQAALEGKPYQEFLERSLKKVLAKTDPKLSPLIAPKEGNLKNLCIVITSNKGLCGGFNINLIRFLFQKDKAKQSDFIVIGKKGAVLINSLGGKIIADFSESEEEIVSAVFNFAVTKYLDEDYGSMDLFYNRFISSLRYEPTEEKILPFALKTLSQENLNATDPEYLIEPSPEELIDPLLRSYIEEKVRFALVENEAGEHSARMIAMKNATDNATDVIFNLTLLRNKLRQQKITYELLDMITAKESVEQTL